MKRRRKDPVRQAAARKANATRRQDDNAVSGMIATEPTTLRACDHCHEPTLDLDLRSQSLWCRSCKRFNR